MQMENMRAGVERTHQEKSGPENYQYVSPHRVLTDFEDKILTLGTKRLGKTRQLLTPGKKKVI